MKSFPFLRTAVQRTVVFFGFAVAASAEAGFWTSLSMTNGVVPAADLASATLLDDGQVLLAGGYYNSSNAFLYDPASGTCSQIVSMNAKRDRHTATRLFNGKVLVTGGFGLKSAELYDPKTRTWELAGDMAYWRQGHTAILLNNGKVLVTGGNSTTLSAEIYDPSNGFWTLTGSMNTNRVSETATLLTSGKVLVAGYHNGSGGYTSSELHDPDTGLWTFTGSMSTNFSYRAHVATVLPNGHVLATGGLKAELVRGFPPLQCPRLGLVIRRLCCPQGMF
ncbi:MAG TPA: hypothetical protein VFZ59_19385 [Verrucomicrobiae bacterium]|nr:hypothetical protein [Verrucomicrobiae bacterium]